MRVTVFDHTGLSDEHEETFEGTPAQIEIYLRRAFSFLNREVISGDVEGCLEAIDEQQNYSVSVEGEGELAGHEPFLLKHLREQEESLEKMAPRAKKPAATPASAKWHPNEPDDATQAAHWHGDNSNQNLEYRREYIPIARIGGGDAAYWSKWMDGERAMHAETHGPGYYEALEGAYRKRPEDFPVIAAYGGGLTQSVQSEGPNHYGLDDGAHRLAIAHKLGMTHIPAFVGYPKAKKSESLEKMAIANLQPGARNAYGLYDYSHLLDPAHRAAGYTIRLNDMLPFNKDERGHKAETVLMHGNNIVGKHLSTIFPGDKVRVGFSEIHPDHTEKGLGTSMYEASYAHAYHHHGVRLARGGIHSTSASRTHERISDRHGLNYEPERNVGPEQTASAKTHDEWHSKPAGSFDEKYAPYQYALKSEVNLAKEMQGLLATLDSYFDTARWMAGAEEAVSPLAYRQVLLKHDGDLELAALAAYGLAHTDENLAALRGLVGSGSLAKAEEQPVPAPQAITPAHPDASETAEEVQRAFEAGSFHYANLNGKHSGGSMIGRDPQTQHLYLLKPGSGDNSPAAGVHEEDASQSRREVAFWYAADLLGLSEYLPRADLLYIDGQEVAAIRMLPLTFKNLGTALKANPSLMPHCMRPYLYSGLLHKWAIMDFVLGNPDRHSQNIMIGDDDRTLRLIDHGSAMAGRSFDPAHDENSFIPYYLRAWTGLKFNQMDAAQQARQMPTAGIDGAKAVERWLRDIDPKRLAAKLQSYGIDPEPMVERLEYIKMMPGPKDQAVNKLWLGIGTEQPR